MDEKLSDSSNDVLKKSNEKFGKNQIIIPVAMFIIVVLGAVSLFLIRQSKQKALQITPTVAPIQTPSASTQTPTDIPVTTVIAQNLEVPWAIAFLPASSQGGPDNRMLVTERPGRVRIIDKNGNLNPTPILEIDVVRRILGEGGLHGITIHPEFEKNRFVYLYYTYANQGNGSLNRVSRYVFDGGKLNFEKIIVDKIPGALFHDGGRIKFGPDKLLYVATGDAQEPSLAQNKNSTAGKILRVTPDGKPAPGNPFGNLVYSYGHRNPQGITWDSAGFLWETEHGSTNTDELNVIEIGKNYGWPEVKGDEQKDGFVVPIIHSGSDTWAPGGAAYLNGAVFFVGLRGQALYEVAVKNGRVIKTKTHFKNQFGRIRDVVVGPDNMLYITTSNKDGRGNVNSGDDKIIRVNPQKL